jgi:hypothetical protein
MPIVLPQAFLKIEIFCLTCSKSHEETELQITRQVPEIKGKTEQEETILQIAWGTNEHEQLRPIRCSS